MWKAIGRSRAILISALSLALAGSVVYFFCDMGNQRHQRVADYPSVGQEVLRAASPVEIEFDRETDRDETKSEVGIGVIAGRVYGNDGVSEEAALVRIRRNERRVSKEASESEVHTLTDINGDFRFVQLGVGSYTIVAESRDDIGVERCEITLDRPVASKNLILRSAYQLGGLVLGPSNETIPDGMVYPIRRNGFPMHRKVWNGEAVPVEPDGGFLFTTLEPGDWELHVVAPGFAPTVTPPIPTGETNAIVRLSAGVPVSGRVIERDTGGNLAGAEVQASFLKIDGPQAVAMVDVHGNFQFSSLAPESYALSIWEPEESYVVHQVSAVLDVGPSAITNLSIYVVRGGSVEGRVFSSATKEGIAKVEIECEGDGGQGFPAKIVQTDNDGRYRIKGLPEGRYRVRPQELQSFSAPQPKSISVYVRAGKCTSAADFTMDAGVTVRGKVSDVDGEPQEGATVSCRGCPFRRPVTTNSDGEFVLAGLQGGEEVMIFASKGDLVADTLGPTVVPLNGLSGIELILSQPGDGVISGWVVDERNRPLRGRISPSLKGESGPPIVQGATIDPEGRFVLSGLRPGRYGLGVVYENRDPIELSEVQVIAGRPVRSLRLVYPVGELSLISGRVIDEHGNGIQGYLELFLHDGERRWSQQSGRSTVEGKFILEGVSRGLYTIAASADGFERTSVTDVVEGMSGVEVVLSPRPRISGQVVDEQGAPVPRFRIALSSDSGATAGQNVTHTIHHPEGEFVLDVTSGTYVLTITAEGFTRSVVPIGYVEPRREAEGITVRLESAQQWRGRVVDVSGNPVLGAAVVLRELAFGCREAAAETVAVTEADGFFTMDAVDSSVYPMLWACHGEIGIGSVSTAGEPRSGLGNIVLHPTGSLEVIVLSDGSPVLGAYVSVSRGGQSATKKVDDDGLCLFEGLAPGVVTIEQLALGGDTNTTFEQAEIVSGEVTSVQLTY